MPAGMHYHQSAQIQPQRLVPKPFQVALAFCALHLFKELGMLMLVLGRRLVARIIVRAQVLAGLTGGTRGVGPMR